MVNDNVTEQTELQLSSNNETHSGRKILEGHIHFYTDDRASYSQPCQVVIETNGDILLEFRDAGGYWQYRGVRKGEGHYELHSMSLPSRFEKSRGTLHCFKATDDHQTTLEGTWIDYKKGERTIGMWRILFN